MKRAVLALAAAVLLARPAAAAGGGEGGLGYPIFNLVLLVGVIVYFARKPVLAFFADRRAGIQNALQTAASLRSEAEQRYSEWQRKLAELDEELDAIRGKARERAESERDRIIADANATAERIRSDAAAAIDQELRRSRAVLREEAADLAVELAGNLLHDQVTASDRERLVGEFIESIEVAGASPNPRS